MNDADRTQEQPFLFDEPPRSHVPRPQQRVRVVVEATQEILAEDVLEAVDALPVEGTQEIRNVDILEINVPIETSPALVFDLPKANSFFSNYVPAPPPQTPLFEEPPIFRVLDARQLMALAPPPLTPRPSADDAGAYAARPHPASIAPVAIDRVEASIELPPLRTADWSLADFTAQLFIRRQVPTRFKVIVGAAVAVSLFIIAFAVAQTHTSVVPHAAAASIVAPRTTATTNATTPRVAPAHETTTTSTSGTIALSRTSHAHTLVVDGKRASAASVIVSCGAHTIRVGGEKNRIVDVPCGGTLTVDVGSSTLSR